MPSTAYRFTKSLYLAQTVILIGWSFYGLAMNREVGLRKLTLGTEIMFNTVSIVAALIGILGVVFKQKRMIFVYACFLFLLFGASLVVMIIGEDPLLTWLFFVPAYFLLANSGKVLPLSYAR